ncbi:putative myb transcription factor [Tieghemostelium lacteum]|uniref:Putative myb transcription factor n=1 Tax=Tieghemostelium lacteum TaxID=361077 RepID=A0A151ZIS3_TIELA|nr:putative myb transcription factor [Tieghemostelium lacteum]|eukprot:KYQ93817.1 putative myb transcription factor [Tieghemostelium lacteum]
MENVEKDVLSLRQIIDNRQRVLSQRYEPTESNENDNIEDYDEDDEFDDSEVDDELIIDGDDDNNIESTISTQKPMNFTRSLQQQQSNPIHQLDLDIDDEDDQDYEDDEEDLIDDIDSRPLKKHKNLPDSSRTISIPPLTTTTTTTTTTSNNNNVNTNYNFDKVPFSEQDFRNYQQILKKNSIQQEPPQLIELNTLDDILPDDILSDLPNHSTTDKQYAKDALQLNREYQQLLKTFQVQIDEAIKRNSQLIKKITTQQKLSYSNMYAGITQKKNERKAGVSYFSYEIQVDGVTQTFYPAENLDSEMIKKNFGTMPLFFKCRKWSKGDINLLHKGVQDRNKAKQMFRISESNLTRAEYSARMDELNNIAPKEFENYPLTFDDFAMICMDSFAQRQPDEIKLRWDNFENPSINNGNFSKAEDKELLRLALKYEGRQWHEVARELNDKFAPWPPVPEPTRDNPHPARPPRPPIRTPISCLIRYQRSLNPTLMKREWTREEDETLKMAFAIHGDKNWQTIAEYLSARTGQQCLHRWQKTLNPNIKRGKWSAKEDELLRNAVEIYGYGNWVMVKKHVPGRTDMQCRERWCNVIDPQLNKTPFTPEEDRKLKELIEQHGVGKWATIASALGTRTDNQCWRRWKQVHNKSEDLVKYQEKISKKKQVVVGNFVGREKERSSLSVDDILEVQESLKTNTTPTSESPNLNSNNNNNNA